MKKAHYETTTQKLLGWYDDSIHSTIPTPTIEVRDDIWEKAINSNANYVDIINNNVIVKDLRTDLELLVQAKADKLTQIESDYQTAITADITYLTKVIRCDKDSLDLMAQNLAIGSVPNGFYWRTADNTDLPMTYAELQGLGSAIQTRGQPLFTNKVNRNIAVYTFDENKLALDGVTKLYPTIVDAILAIEAI